MAGDYEYFAAQGQHPFAFALAELIDNSLRATKSTPSDQTRSITVSLLVDAKGQQGMVCVRDNGVGMTVKELNDWAVMNLSMEDRGLLNKQEDASKGQEFPTCSCHCSGKSCTGVVLDYVPAKHARLSAWKAVLQVV